ncbi:DUF6973 domain-containing protein [Xenorhabdus bovienii]|uniref:DUF6973 domain-containing protein n=3 Tax=Xenorhabdus bovienii TaxID=40576 RepID=UPI0023B32905|nr:hypothetical protein [Xenorhabdus bovienii]MDE9545927.1 hypothetical protein [Xenorhabdus bovienii]
MQQDLNRNPEYEEVRDLLKNSPDTLIKECCEIAGVPYSATHIKQHNIAMLLTCNSVYKHLAKIKEIVKASGGAAAKVAVVHTEARSMLPIPRDGVPEELAPYFRPLASVTAVETPQLDAYQCASKYAWIGVSDGKAVLYWHRDRIEKSDWVALYDSQSKDTNSYLTYQWVSDLDGHYVTDNPFFTALSIRYFRYNVDAGTYQEIYRTSDLNLPNAVDISDERRLRYGCWVSPTSSLHTYINWNPYPDSGPYDWVGLFPNRSAGDNDYYQWQWASKGSSYETTYAIQPGFHARHYIWDGYAKTYVCKRRSIPIANAYIDLKSIYGLYKQVADQHLLTSDSAFFGSEIFSILVDQLKKAAAGEPSVFSLGYSQGYESFWGGENLIWKNLSYEEVTVIVSWLTPLQYKDCLMIYYKTYKMAIEIADNDERNAKRHVYWQISMAQAFGEDFACAIGKAHEEGRPGSEADNLADDFNNEKAISYYKENKYNDALKAANYLWDSGKLKKIQEERLKDEL